MIEYFLATVVSRIFTDLVSEYIFRNVFVFVFLTFVTCSLPDLVALASPEPELPTLHLDLSSCDPLEVTITKFVRT